MATTGAPPGEPGGVKLGRFWEGVSERSGERLRAEGRPAGRPEASGREGVAVGKGWGRSARERDGEEVVQLSGKGEAVGDEARESRRGGAGGGRRGMRGR